MSAATLTVRVEPEHAPARDLPGNPGISLADLLAAHGLPLNTRCGGRGLCHGCEVELRAGRVKVGPATVAAPATVRACGTQLLAEGYAVVHLPARSLLGHLPQVCESFQLSVPSADLPLFEPSVGRDTAFAVDVGTTTVAMLLVDIPSGEILARAGAFNAQLRFGDNVLTRIEAADTPASRRAMQAALVNETLAELLQRVCTEADRGPERVAGGAVTGNTTMLHLLAGEDPTPMGIAPFTPRFLESRRITAGDLQWPGAGEAGMMSADAPLHLLPGIAAYIGADIAAGLLATGMTTDPAPALLVDIGTNGEIVLQHQGRLTACATAAGPAFEGAGLSCGTRAHRGAVGAIRVVGDPFRVEAETIGGVGDGHARGICGSAYVDFLASGRRAGLLLDSGRFDPDLWDRLAPSCRVQDNGRKAIRIAGSASISERDVACLLQAKAAIAAGISTLLESAGLRPDDVGALHLAGGFGMHVNVAHAVASDLLPGFAPGQVRVVGNTSLAGALLALRDRSMLEEMERLCRRVDVIELNLQEGFEERYIDSLLLP